MCVCVCRERGRENSSNAVPEIKTGLVLRVLTLAIHEYRVYIAQIYFRVQLYNMII